MNVHLPLKIQQSERGFSLIEILIALTIFSIFATAFLTGQNAQVSDSMMMQKEMLYHQLAEGKLQSLLLAPPHLEESLTLTPKTGTFEEEGYPEMEYQISFKRMVLPSSQIFFSSPSSESDSADGETDTSNSSDLSEQQGPRQKQTQEVFMRKIYDIMKKNMEEMVWQISVKVKERDTDFPYELTALLPNEKAQVNMNF
jgi:prepilin-type N-terminal cleavage/methylation domain-containing protein